MTIMVTGATGFIGSHLCIELINRNHTVFALTHSGKTRKVAPILNNANFQLHTGDILDTITLQDIIKDNRVDTVFHLAAQLPTDNDRENPMACFNTNAGGTLNLLAAAKSGGVGTFIYASTMSVYSEPPVHLPVDEIHSTQPPTIYGVAKLTGEFCCRLYSTDMTVIVLRYGGVYGLNCRESDAVPTFLRSALKNKPLIIHGDGIQSSDFTHVDDIVEGTLLAWEKGKPEVYNIGSGEETSILELSQKIINIADSTSEIQIGKVVTERPFRFVLDIEKARKQLGYRPRPLDAGLKKYAEELKEEV
jgi:nucleoside-diphosphate-sugar epimerase